MSALTAQDCERAVRETEAFVRGAACIRPVRERSTELLQTLDAISVQGRNLQGALLVVLLGGTGVGKSTLLNALAGREVAVVSPIRPCTTETTWYSHRDNDLGPLGAVIAGTDRIVVNDADGLRGKIVADPPDFDSMLQSNRRKLLEILKVADLVIGVVDPEKYGNLSLYRLLRRFREGRSFLFVMNKSDHGIEPSVVEDFRAALAAAGIERPRIFTLSARNASGEFAALDEVIRREIDRATIRRIKDSNLSALLAHTRASVLRLLPGDLDRRLEELPRIAEERVAEAADRIAGELTRALFEEDPRVRKFVLSASSLSVGGLFGMYLAAAGKLGALLTSTPSASRAQDPIELRISVRNALEKADEGRIRILLERVGSEIASRLAGLEIEPEGPLVPDAADAARGVVTASVELAAERTSEFVERASAGFVGTLLYNALPMGWIVYCLYRLLAHGSERAIDILAFVAILFGIFLLQHPLAERSFRRRGGRFMRRLQSELTERVRTDLAGRCLPPVRSFSDSLAARVRTFRAPQ